MTWSHVGGSGKVDGDSVSSKTITYSPTTGNAIFVLVQCNATVSSIRDSASTSLTLLSSTASPHGHINYIGYYPSGAPSGITSFTVNITAGSYLVASVEEFSGNPATITVDHTTNANGGTTSQATGNITNTDANCLNIAQCSGDDNSNTAWGVNSGWTTSAEEGDTTVHTAGKSIYQIASSNTGPWGVTFTYSVGTSTMSAMLTSFAPASGGGGDTFLGQILT